MCRQVRPDADILAGRQSSSALVTGALQPVQYPRVVQVQDENPSNAA